MSFAESQPAGVHRFTECLHHRKSADAMHMLAVAAHRLMAEWLLSFLPLMEEIHKERDKPLGPGNTDPNHPDITWLYLQHFAAFIFLHELLKRG